MSNQGINIKISTSAQLAALKQTEQELIKQITAARSAGKSIKDLGAQTKQLAAVQGQMKGMGFSRRLLGEMGSMTQSIPVLGRVMTAANGGVGILSMGLAALTGAAIGARAALSAFSRMEDLQTTFVTLLGSVDAAKERMAELSRFAAETPFALPEIAQASKVLEGLTGGALSTGNGLRLVGDVAAATGANFGDMAVTVGRLYQGLRDGTPVGEAAARMTELTGINLRGAKSWGEVEAALAKFNGEMSRRSETVSGKESTLGDAMGMLMVSLGRPIAPTYKAFLETLTKALESVTAGLEGFIAMSQRSGGAINALAQSATALAAIFAGKFLLPKVAAAYGTLVAWLGRSTAAILTETAALNANTVANAANQSARGRGGILSKVGGAIAGGVAKIPGAAAPMAAAGSFMRALAGVPAVGIMTSWANALATAVGPLAGAAIGLALGNYIQKSQFNWAASMGAGGASTEDDIAAAQERAGSADLSVFFNKARDVQTEDDKDKLRKETEDKLAGAKAQRSGLKWNETLQKNVLDGDIAALERFASSLENIDPAVIRERAEALERVAMAEADAARDAKTKDALHEVQNAAIFDGLSPAEQLFNVKGRIASDKSITQEGARFSSAQKEAAAERIVELTKQLLALEKQIADAKEPDQIGPAWDATAQAQVERNKQDAADAAARKEIDADLAISEAEASGDDGEASRLKWNRDRAKLEAELAAMGDADSWGKSARMTDAQLSRPERAMDPSIVSALRAMGGAGISEAYRPENQAAVAARAMVAEVKISNGHLQKLVSKPPVKIGPATFA